MRCSYNMSAVMQMLLLLWQTSVMCRGLEPAAFITRLYMPEPDSARRHGTVCAVKA